MEDYTVRYRMRGQFFYRNISAIEDGIIEKFRWFRLLDDTVIELNIDEIVRIEYAPERLRIARKNAKKLES